MITLPHNITHCARELLYVLLPIEYNIFPLATETAFKIFFFVYNVLCVLDTEGYTNATYKGWMEMCVESYLQILLNGCVCVFVPFCSRIHFIAIILEQLALGGGVHNTFSINLKLYPLISLMLVSGRLFYIFSWKYFILLTKRP